MTTTVYFDLDGTLLEYDTPFGELFAQVLPVDPTEEMTVRYSERLLAGISEIADDPYERAFAAVCDAYDLDADPEALASEYVKTEAEATHVAPVVTELVEAVATRHRTGILTNGDGRMQRRKLDMHGFTDLVETVIVSNEVGVRKPDQAIFEEAKDRLPADTYVYIGDTFEEDVVPAREAGFEAVYVGAEHHPDAPVTTMGTEELASVLLPLLSPSK